MNMPVVLGLLRHLLTVVGGGLVGRGLLTSGDMETAIGAIVVLVGIVASVVSKRAPEETLRRP